MPTLRPSSVPRRLLAAAALLFAQAAIAQGGTASIEVLATGMRHAAGSLGCRLFASAAGFPGQAERAVAAQLTPIANGQARCRFAQLPAGSYAIAVVHDENGNGRLDTNLLGLPSEGYGASLNRSSGLTPPRWDDARFELADGEARALTIHLRY